MPVGSLSDNHEESDGQIGKKDQSSLLAQRASSDIDAGELEHQLVN